MYITRTNFAIHHNFNIQYSMEITFKKNIPLKQLTTFKIGLGKVKLLTKITKKEQIPQLYTIAKKEKLPVIILGEGSNSIAPDRDIEAIIALNRIKGIKQISPTIIEANSGEILDDLVSFTTQQQLYGIESLSGVPGTVGASPIQNVGAYGQDISQTLTQLEAYDSKTNKFIILTNKQCQFTYRDSIFKNKAKNRYFISSITVKLRKNRNKSPLYPSLQKYIEQNQLEDLSSPQIREYILDIRNSKIPDYHRYPNAGSFFKNVLINQKQFNYIEGNFGKPPFSDVMNGLIKIPIGWLIDKANLKGKVFNGIKVDDNNALILVNESANSFQQLENTIKKIQKIIYDNFNIEIEPEPIFLDKIIED